MSIERKMSNKVDDKWLKDLRECMEDYAEPLPEGLWDELESELAQPKVIPFWRRWSAVAAAVALVLIVSSLALSDWFMPLMDSPEMRVANQMAEESAVPDADGAVKVLEARSVKVQGEKSKEISGNRPAEVMSVMMLDAGETAENETAEVEAEEKNEAHADVHEDVKAETYPRYRSTERTRMVSDNNQVALRNRNRSEQGLELGIHTGGMPYGSSKDFSGMSRLASHRTMDANAHLAMGTVNNKMSAYSHVLFSNRDKYTHTDIKHHMPINVVASVKWHFAEDWALESGVSYTYMQSDLHSGSNLYWEDTQKLHYVGIPVKIHRNLWKNSLISLYASAGGMLEKCVKGTLESVYVTSNSTKEEEHHSLQAHPFQWSVSASVGAQVNLIRSLSLFVEPGVAYFFDDNSQIETIRKEHPFNFNLQFGVRFDLFK